MKLKFEHIHIFKRFLLIFSKDFFQGIQVRTWKQVIKMKHKQFYLTCWVPPPPQSLPKPISTNASKEVQRVTLSSHFFLFSVCFWFVTLISWNSFWCSLLGVHFLLVLTSSSLAPAPFLRSQWWFMPNQP